MATIKQIDGRSIHQIQSGQVIVDLCSVVKELVENSIDAGASAIDVRFKNQGLESIEVQDNGSGISPANYSSVALKHFTSKLSSYSDIFSLVTFGFRGEALASLCALSTLTVTTCLPQDVPKGTKLTFESSGKLQDTCVTAAQRGTTVSVEKLFHNLPVRRRELDRNIKKEWQKVIALLNQYACIQENLKICVSHQPTKGKKVFLFSTQGNRSIRDNIINIFGAKAMTALVSLDLSMEIKSSTRPGVHVMVGSSSEPKEVRIMGHVSSPIHGEGRHTPDRQMFFVNGRPCALPQVAKAFNEVYRLYNSSQSPFILADIRLDTDLYDVNVSPDKRSILLHDQNHLLDTLRTSLTNLFDAYDCSVPVAHPSRIVNQHPQENRKSAKAPIVPRCEPGAKELQDMSQSEQEMDNDDDGTAGSTDKLQSKSKSTASVTQYKIHQQDQSLSTMFARQKSYRPHQPGSSPSDASSSRSLDGGDRTAFVDDHESDKIRSSRGLASPDVAIPKRSGQSTTSTEEATSDNTKSQIVIGGNNIEDIPDSFKTRSCGNFVGIKNPKSNLLVARPTLSPIIGQRANDPSMLPFHVDPTSCAGMSSFQIQGNRSQGSSDPSLKDGSQPPEGLLPVTKNNIELQLFKPASDDRNEQSSVGNNKDYKMANVESSTQTLQSDSRRKDATVNLLHYLSVTEQYVRYLMQDEAHQRPIRGHASLETRQVEEIAADDAESRLPLIIDKSDFAQMRVAGQFNLGFILAVKPARKLGSGIEARHDELVIIDQHASDEKYNFERLQSSTAILAQRLAHPKRLNLTALEEEILIENTLAIEANGFKVDVDTTGRLPVGSRCQLIALPLSRETTFNMEDLEELISLLGDISSEYSQIARPSKVRKMLAMRACRSSVMIGKALTKSQMYGLVKHMGELEKPWNCPHGRPTMRHLIRLQSWDGTGWNADLESCPQGIWEEYLEGSVGDYDS